MRETIYILTTTIILILLILILILIIIKTLFNEDVYLTIVNLS